MDGGGDRLEEVLHPSNIAIIREVYDGPDSQDMFVVELEKALESRCSIIVIEPSQLGDETARWITAGNYLHKMAVISGFSSVVTGFVWPHNFVPQAPLAIFSVLCTGLYTASWQFDHCVKYQVERDPGKLARLPILSALTATSPVVLVRKDDTRRKILHCTVSVAAAALCVYKLYGSVK
ncbi:transmembrane protein 11-A, mitochondrial isoform X2 [Anthonomus grandis grandis]|uniref:transmembrane protein 11-A, mitochondrial isoform X2 n=1 Tax=Anthonomus grandis grandis TaxID=2921223 RepID=UPI002166812B|nr:transmembrane protein 11-A, mitochondrial isoform X2 [Anthonomus grandis grandis]